MKGDRAVDVGMPRDEAGDCGDFRFGSRKRAGTHLLVLCAPERRKVSIEVESLFACLQLKIDAVEILDTAPGQQPVIASAALHRIPPPPPPPLLLPELPTTFRL